MSKLLKCLLCHEDQNLRDYYKDPSGLQYWRCDHCGLIFLDPQFHLNWSQQTDRYNLHQNNVLDERYQGFLRSVVEAVQKGQTPGEEGLDYGGGPASVICYLLQKEGYSIRNYDPLYFPQGELLRKTYHYITCTEVVEHFTEPHREFEKLYGLLKRGGRLYIKTGVTDQVSDFAQWHYRRDPTHVVFYNRQTFEYIQQNWNYSELLFHSDCVQLACSP